MGTQVECERFAVELARACPPGVVREVSGFYPNRAPSVLGRVYLDVAIPGEPADDALTSRPDAASGGRGTCRADGGGGPDEPRTDLR